jgi:hypothetical protein
MAQLAVHGGHRQRHHAGDLLTLQADEVGQLHHLGGACVLHLQLLQQPVQRQQVGGLRLFTGLAQLAERPVHQSPAGATGSLGGHAVARMVHQHLAHHQRDGGEEVLPVVPVRRPGHQLDQGLLQQVFGRQRRAVVATQARLRQSQQLTLHPGQQLAQRLAVSGLPVLQQLGERAPPVRGGGGPWRHGGG